MGLGLLGTAIARRLIDGGVPVLGHDIQAEKLAHAGEIGIQPASLHEQFTRCSAILIAVFDAEQVADVIKSCAEFAGTHASQNEPTLICSSTCAPNEIRELELKAALAGLRFLEFPISGSSHQVEDGKGLGLIAGKPEYCEPLTSLFQTVCSKTMYMGDCGQATSAKLAINLVLQLNRGSLAEGLLFAETMGLDLQTTLKALQQSAACSQVMDTKGEKMITGDFSPQSHITLSIKDGSIIQKMATTLGLSLPLSSAALALAKDTERLLGSSVDPSAVIKTLRLRSKKVDFTPQEEPDDPETQEIIDRDNRRIEAMLAGDTSSIADFLDDNLVYTHSSGRSETKHQLLTSIDSCDVRYLRIRRIDPKLIRRPGFMLMHGTVEMHVLLASGERKMHNHFQSIWTKDVAQWRMVAWAATPVKN